MMDRAAFLFTLFPILDCIEINKGHECIGNVMTVCDVIRILFTIKYTHSLDCYSMNLFVCKYQHHYSLYITYR